MTAPAITLVPDERTVLLALARLGSAESYRVAEEASLAHPEAHAALEALARKGLVRQRVIRLGWQITTAGRLVAGNVEAATPAETPTHHYTAEALGLTPEEMADPSLDEPANVDVEAHLRWLETGEGEPWPPEVAT